MSEFNYDMTRDECDAVITYLKENTDLSWKQVGMAIGLSHNAVRNRWRRRPARIDDITDDMSERLLGIVEEIELEFGTPVSEPVSVPAGRHEPVVYSRERAAVDDEYIREYPRVYMKAAIFDIECMSFETAGYNNHMICCSILPLDSDKVKTVRLEYKDRNDDKRLLKETIAELSKYDILIGHNIARFDFGWLHSRLLWHDLPQPPRKWAYFDTLVMAQRIAIKGRKSLAFLNDYFRLGGIKTSIYPTAWRDVSSPDERLFNKAMAEIIYHCEEDVKLNRKLFDVLHPIDRKAVNIPYTKKW